MISEQLNDIDGLETAFKTWCTDSGNSHSTAKTYWTRIHTFPFFTLRDSDQAELIGKLNKQIETSEQLTAVRQFIQFLYEEYEKDAVSDEDYTALQIKKNAVLGNLELSKKEKARNRDDRQVKRIQEHHLHADELTRLLREAAPDRARFYYLLYAGGFRIGELKRHGRKHVRSEYGDHGAVNILRTQHLPGDGEHRSSKSKQSRTVEFLSKYPTLILSDAPTGTWVDENDVEWSDVFYPAFYAQLENHYLRKYCNAIGVHRVTPHSFRHMRITHLVHSEEFEKDWVQRRAGHADGKTTDHYTQTVFDREPQTLEAYLDANDIDLLDVLDAD